MWAGIVLAAVILACGGLLVALAIWPGSGALLNSLAGLAGAWAPAQSPTYDIEASVAATMQAMAQQATQQASLAPEPTADQPPDPYPGYARLQVGQPDPWIPAQTPILVTWGWITDTETQLEDFLEAVSVDFSIGTVRTRDTSQYWSEPREYGDYDGNGDTDYTSVWEYPISEGLCNWEYSAVGKLTLDRPV